MSAVVDAAEDDYVEEEQSDEDMQSDVGASDEEEDDNADNDEQEEVWVGPPRSPAGRWRFMANYVERWFQGLKYKNDRFSSFIQPRFDTFLVHMPGVATTDDDYREFLFSTELVAYMLALDKATWWYAKKRHRPWFAHYDPNRYDPDELVPRMTFAMSSILMVRGNDRFDAAGRLHRMLTDTDTKNGLYHDYMKTKRRLLEKEDREGKLRDFQIPTRIKFEPAFPDDASQIRGYLRDAVVAVRGFKQRCDSVPGSPFRFEGVTLKMKVEYLGACHAEVREMLATGVPVVIKLKHGVRGAMIPDTMEWSHYNDGNVYPALAMNPRDLHKQQSMEGVHTLDSTCIASSYELWSAVAYSSAFGKLRVQSSVYSNPPLHEQLARWMGYALAHCTALRSLEIDRFRMTSAEVDAFATVLADPIPSRLLPRSSGGQTEAAHVVKMVCLKADAVLRCHPNGKELDLEGTKVIHTTLDGLRIPREWQFPVVQTIEATQQIEFIVPGHGICSSSLRSVASYHEHAAVSSALDNHRLTSLVIHNEAPAAIVGRFIGLVGSKLRELKFLGGIWYSDDGEPLDQDFNTIVRVCPALETLTLNVTTLLSLSSLTAMNLRELVLEKTALPMAVLIEFFELLADGKAPIARTLQRFTYRSRNQQLNSEAVDAAVAMLTRNNRLQSISLGLEAEIFEVCQPRFEALGNVRVQVERPPEISKLAFLSVIKHHQQLDAGDAIGQVDTACISHVLQMLGRGAQRRIMLFKGAEWNGSSNFAAY